MKRNKGYFLLEGIVILGIFTMIITVSTSIFSNSLKIKKSIEGYFYNEINYKNNIEYFLKEIRSGKDMYIDKNKLKYELEIAGKMVSVTYYFSGTSLYRKASNSEKLEVFLDRINGKFLLKDNLLRIIFKFKNKEEEYIIYVQQK